MQILFFKSFHFHEIIERKEKKGKRKENKKIKKNYIIAVMRTHSQRISKGAHTCSSSLTCKLQSFCIEIYILGMANCSDEIYM